jgi:vacuolar protein sorting-associated protein 1
LAASGVKLLSQPHESYRRSVSLRCPHLASFHLDASGYRLPKLRATVAKLIAENAAELELLPKPPSQNPVVELLELVTGFCTELREAVFGKHDDKSLVHNNRANYGIFKVAIRATAPDFRPFEDYTQYRRPESPLPEDEEEPASDVGSVSGDDSSSTVSEEPPTRTLDLWGVRKVIQS